MSEVAYRFPMNLQADCSTLAGQAEKVLEEARELAEACQGHDEGHILREAWDVIQAAEGVLRKMPEEAVHRAHADVMLRCSRRGDYNIEDSANWEKD